VPKVSGTESASQRVYDQVRVQILDGTYPGGTLLSEGEVSAQVGVSRTPVREAFLQLAAEGMLALYPKKGALVLPVGTAELRDALSARAVIEPWAVAVVARRADRGPVVATLRRLTEEATGALRRGEDTAFQEADRAFHQTLLAAAGNHLLAGFYSTLRDRQVRAGTLAVLYDPGRGERSMQQHATIADAIERGDPEGAASGIRSHIGDTAKSLGLAEPT
jgi:DNA-binding GntR family transcriptional regulator